MTVIANTMIANEVAAARAAQRSWSGVRVAQRMRVLRRMRAELARRANEFAAAMPAELRRTTADTLVAEVLPLLDAVRFLEKKAVGLLASRRLDDEGRSAWLGSVEAEVCREPVGVVLLVAPGNYPLFLAGVQCLQGLAAGNAVLWKPAPGTGAVARLFADCWRRAATGWSEALRVLDESKEAATEAIRAGVDRVFLTGSPETGTVVMRELAETQTSSVLELSGCDAVFVLEGAELPRVVDALTFGMRLNGSSTCMAPRRVFVTDTVANELMPRLRVSFQGLDATLVETNGLPEDALAPVLSVVRVANMQEALDADAQCPYALTAAVFGPENTARALAERVNAGTVFINDLIAPAADARVPFGGRKRSGFGVTRGAEGLLAMTNVKTVLTQRSRSRRHFEVTTAAHEELFSAYIAVRHPRDFLQGVRAVPRLIRAAFRIQRQKGK
jgi:acyl-CoA reductase-like NAD-dependent aldehyde dehydrogenase